MATELRNSPVEVQGKKENPVDIRILTTVFLASISPFNHLVEKVEAIRKGAPLFQRTKDTHPVGFPSVRKVRSAGMAVLLAASMVLASCGGGGGGRTTECILSPPTATQIMQNANNTLATLGASNKGSDRQAATEFVAVMTKRPLPPFCNPVEAVGTWCETNETR